MKAAAGCDSHMETFGPASSKKWDAEGYAKLKETEFTGYRIREEDKGTFRQGCQALQEIDSKTSCLLKV